MSNKIFRIAPTSSCRSLLVIFFCLLVATTCAQPSLEEENEEEMDNRPVQCYEEFGGETYGFRHCRKDLPLRVHIFYNITDNDPEPELNASIVMLVRAPHEGWVGFGFGLNGKMVGSNATLGWQSATDPENTLIGDFYLHDYLAPVDPENPDNSQELVFVDVEYVDGHTQLFFKRRLETAMAEELRVDDYAYIVYAMGDLPDSPWDPPLYHGRNMRATYQYKFRTGDLKIILDPEVVAHAVCMVIAFGILIPGAIAVARYRKGKGPAILRNAWIKAYWFQIHIGMNITATAISFIAFMFGLFWIGTHYYKAHMAIGIITMCLTILQPINGWARPKKHSPVTTFYGQPTRYIWEAYHLWVGRLFPIFGWVNMIIGVTITEWTNLLILILFVPFGFASLYFMMSIKFTEPEDKEAVMLDSQKNKNNEASENTPLGVPLGGARGVGYLGVPTPMYDARRPTV